MFKGVKRTREFGRRIGDQQNELQAVQLGCLHIYTIRTVGIEKLLHGEGSQMRLSAEREAKRVFAMEKNPQT